MSLVFERYFVMSRQTVHHIQTVRKERKLFYRKFRIHQQEPKIIDGKIICVVCDQPIDYGHKYVRSRMRYRHFPECTKRY